MLQCQDGIFVEVASCPGLQRCRNVEGRSSFACGEEVGGQRPLQYALADAPCAAQGAAACAVDGAIVLSCDAGVWVEAVHCPPSECGLVPPDVGVGIGCTNGGITVGDRCNFAAGAVICSTDLGAVLGCANGTAVIVQDCEGGTLCTRTAEGIGCF